MRHVRSLEKRYNISIAWNAAKYTRVFDAQLQLGSRKQLRIGRTKWSPPLTDTLFEETNLEVYS